MLGICGYRPVCLALPVALAFPENELQGKASCVPLTFLVLSRSREWVKGLYSETLRTGTVTTPPREARSALRNRPPAAVRRAIFLLGARKDPRSHKAKMQRSPQTREAPGMDSGFETLPSGTETS
jgi:hypothetical protein